MRALCLSIMLCACSAMAQKHIELSSSNYFSGPIRASAFFGPTSFSTNAFPSATNTLTLANNYIDIVLGGNGAITNVAGAATGQYKWATLEVSNSSGGNITFYMTAGAPRAIGASTTNALVIGAGKVGIISVETRDTKCTNYTTAAQQ